MRRLALLLLAWLAGTGFAQAYERILSYDSGITVQRDGTLEVHETIRVVAEGDRIKRGIYRDYPTIYPGRDGGTISIGFAFQSALRDGRPENWRAEPRGNGVRIYVGNPAQVIAHGEHTYELVYRTDRQMGFFADHDELYWNATGNGWDFDIERASARVILPADIPAADIRLEAYTGPQNSQGQDFTATLSGGSPLFATTRPLRAREGLTIVVMFPKGFVTQPVESSLPTSPPVSAQPAYREPEPLPAPPNYHVPLYIAFGGLLLLIGYYYWAWDKLGRDPPAKVVIPLYEPPAGRSPAAMRYLLEMSYDDKCLGAAVLSLAVKGYLRIEEDSGILGFGKTITLERITAPAGALPPLANDEQALFAKLFASGNRLELKQENHSRVRGARSAHDTALDRQYSSGFFRLNGGWHFLGVVLSIAIGWLALSRPGTTDHWPQWYFATATGRITLFVLLLALITNGVFGKLLTAPTVAGQALMDQIRGFRMYLDVAEGEALKRIAGPPLTPQLFESYLPAALALGVEQRWAERFARMFDIEQPNYRPAWYHGGSWSSASIATFSSGLGSSLSSAISSSAKAPGSSSGGGGRGSSGGGGGGGGGGGW